MIDLLIPVLGRPQNAQVVVDSIRAVQIVPTTVYFICTREDDDEIEACKKTGAIVLLLGTGPSEYPRKINHGVGCSADMVGTPNEFVFLGADDLCFHPGWDRNAIDMWLATGKRVIGTNDLCNPTVMRGEHATHSLVHRSYVEDGTIDEPGKLLHEGYDHNYVDTEFIGTAKHRGEFIFAKDSHVEHLHWICGQGQRQDVIYKKGSKSVNRDHHLFNTRQRLWR